MDLVIESLPPSVKLTSPRSANTYALRQNQSVCDICQEGAKLEPMEAWKVAAATEPHTNLPCKEKKYDVMYDIPRVLSKESYIMRNCHHNEYVGLRNRYLKTVPNKITYDRQLLEVCISELASLLAPHFHGPITTSEFMETKKGALRKRYNDALESIGVDFNLEGRDINCSAFVKNEIYDEIKPPRMIMNRNPKFNVAYGRYTIPLEHAMVKVKQFSKGKNFVERGKQFKECIFGQWILEGDCSKYESTQRITLLEDIELSLWKKLLNSYDYSVIENVFYAKMLKRGYTSNGVKFNFVGCRGSGDMDTGLFNSIIMWIACRYFELTNNYGNGNFIVDGDDNLIQIPKYIDNYINTFAHFGLDAKLIIRKDYHDADYCSGKFIKNRGEFVYVQNIRKIINNMAIFRKIKFNHCRKQYYHSLGFMYKTIYGDLPVMKSFSEFLMRDTEGQHVSTEILHELNPVYAEQFQFGPNHIDWDEKEACLEMLMSFDLNYTYADIICHHFDTRTISYQVNEGKRYRVTSKTSNVKIDYKQTENWIMKTLDNWVKPNVKIRISKKFE
jgi:hypothetical protein